MDMSIHLSCVLCILASILQTTDAICYGYCFYWHWYFWFGIFWLMFFIVMGVCMCIRKINQKKRQTRPCAVTTVHTGHHQHAPPLPPAQPVKAPAYGAPSQAPPAYNTLYSQPPPLAGSAPPAGGGMYPPPAYPPPPSGTNDPAYPPGSGPV